LFAKYKLQNGAELILKSSFYQACIIRGYFADHSSKTSNLLFFSVLQNFKRKKNSFQFIGNRTGITQQNGKIWGIVFTKIKRY